MTQLVKKFGKAIKLAGAVEKNPEERLLLPQGLLLPLHPSLDKQPNGPWAQWNNCVDPYEGKIEKTVEPVGVVGRNPRDSNPRLLMSRMTTSTLTPASSGTLRIQTTPVNPMAPQGSIPYQP